MEIKHTLSSLTLIITEIQLGDELHNSIHDLLPQLVLNGEQREQREQRKGNFIGKKITVKIKDELPTHFWYNHFNYCFLLHL
jgi:hypothetical protein